MKMAFESSEILHPTTMSLFLYSSLLEKTRENKNSPYDGEVQNSFQTIEHTNYSSSLTTNLEQDKFLQTYVRHWRIHCPAG